MLHLVIIFRSFDSTIRDFRLSSFRQWSAVCKQVLRDVRYVPWVKNLTSVAYNPQTNVQTEHCYKTNVAPLRYYVAKYQCNADLFLQTLTYAYSDQVHRTAGMNPLSLFLSYQPPGPTTFVTPTARLTAAKSGTAPKVLQYRHLSRISEKQQNVNNLMKCSQKRYKPAQDGQV